MQVTAGQVRISVFILQKSMEPKSLQKSFFPQIINAAYTCLKGEQ